MKSTPVSQGKGSQIGNGEACAGNRFLAPSCSLCGNMKPLRMSHFIPKFVGRWMKKTSATGFLSNAEDMSRRVQDLSSAPLLCGDCELRFSKLESYFADIMFYPFHMKGQRVFDYDERLGLFALSLAWRTVKMTYEATQEEAPELLDVINEAEASWRKILLSGRSEVAPYECHLSFLDFAREGEGLPAGFQWYTLRATDASIVEGIGKLYTYTKLPWMVFVTSIAPNEIEGWKGTKIETRGRIGSPQEIYDADFGGFLLQRAERATSLDLPKWREEAFVKSIEKNPDRFLLSESFKVHVAERDRALRKKLERMPESVKSLFSDVIARALDEPGQSAADNQVTKLMTRIVADALARVSDEEACLLDSGIVGAIWQSKSSGSIAMSTTMCKGIWVSFMVHPHSTRDYQRGKIVEELERLKESRPAGLTVPLAVFSMNVDRDGVSFEMGFWLDSA